MYTPVSEGYCLIIRKTTQKGHTLPFPFPKCPCLAKIIWLYAALRKDLSVDVIHTPESSSKHSKVSYHMNIQFIHKFLLDE